MIPRKLQKEDEIRIIAPSRSLSLISKEDIQTAKEQLEKEGFIVSFSKNCYETNEFTSSQIQSRIEDLHEAFSNPKVKAILSVIGGFNSNQLLKYIDYELIKNNPKIICGYSDITALTNAIYSKTGLITYSGPHFSTWAMKKQNEYNIEYFIKCLVKDEPFVIHASKEWDNDAWYLDQETRNPIPNTGMIVLNKGKAEGKIIGGNLCTLNLLQGTEFMPDISNSILFIEDDSESKPHTFDRDLQSLIHLPDFHTVKGLVIGRFEKESGMREDMLRKIIQTKKELAHIPVIANVDFGHTNPRITFPIGGTVQIDTSNSEMIKIINH